MFLEALQWEALAREIAGDDQPFYDELEQLPNQLQNIATDLIEVMPSLRWTGPATIGFDTPQQRQTVDAMRAERAAWVQLFRAWIDLEGIEKVRAALRQAMPKRVNALTMKSLWPLGEAKPADER